MRYTNSYVLAGSDESVMLAQLAEDEGFETIDAMIERFALSSVVPGICPCGYTVTRLEPDNSEGWCEECEAPTAVAVTRLAGVV